MLVFIDPKVATVAALFVVASVALAALTVWFWRNSQLESPVLAPLEVMSERRFRRASEERRAELLESVRALADERPSHIPWEESESVSEGEFDFEPEDDPGPTLIDPLLGPRGN